MLGLIALRRGQLADAVALFDSAIEANPRYTEALLGLGKAKLALNEPAEALAPLRKAIEVDPKFAEAHYQLGNALARLGRSAEAEEEHAPSARIQAEERKAYGEKLEASQPRN